MKINEQPLNDPAAVKQSYREEGYVVFRGVLKDEDLDPLRARLAQTVDTFARHLHEKDEIPSLYEDEPFSRRLATLCAGRTGKGKGSLAGWRRGDVFGPEIYRIYTNPSIVAGLKTVLGPEVTNHGVHALRAKLPEDRGTAYPFHQDSQYFNEPRKGVRVNRTQYAHIVTTWVALVPATVEKGCLWVIPRSHHWGYIDGARAKDGQVHASIDAESRGNPVPVAMEPGDFLMMTNLTFHGSKLNNTDEVRWSIDFRSHRSNGENKREQDAIDYVNAKAFSMKTAPLVVATQEGGIPTFEEWVASRREASYDKWVTGTV